MIKIPFRKFIRYINNIYYSYISFSKKSSELCDKIHLRNSRRVVSEILLLRVKFVERQRMKCNFHWVRVIFQPEVI